VVGPGILTATSREGLDVKGGTGLAWRAASGSARSPPRRLRRTRATASWSRFQAGGGRGLGRLEFGGPVRIRGPGVKFECSNTVEAKA